GAALDDGAGLGPDRALPLVVQLLALDGGPGRPVEVFHVATGEEAPFAWEVVELPRGQRLDGIPVEHLADQLQALGHADRAVRLHRDAAIALEMHGAAHEDDLVRRARVEDVPVAGTDQVAAVLAAAETRRQDDQKAEREEPRDESHQNSMRTPSMRPVGRMSRTFASLPSEVKPSPRMTVPFS